MAVGNPISLTDNVASRIISQIATESQTDFTISGGYRLNAISVYRNGVRLVSGRDYSAADGSTVVLLSGASLSDVLEFHIFDDFRVADAIVSNASHQNIEGNLTIAGILTVTSLDLTSLTVSDSISIGGTLTYEDVTNVDSIGIITARTDLHVGAGLSVVGVSTFTGNAIFSGDVDLGSGTSDTITIAGKLDSNLIPSTSDEKNLGSSSLKWKDLYVDGTGNIDTLVSGDGTFSTNLGIGTANPTNYGGAVKLALSSSGHTGLSIAAGTSSDSNIFFADGTTGDATHRGNIKYAHDGDSMRFSTAAIEKLRITSDGSVGIGTTNPSAKLEIKTTNEAGLYITDSDNANNAPYIRVLGKRSDGNVEQSFTGQLFLASLRTDQKIASDKKLGTILFGGNHTNTSEANILYAASIAGVAGDDFDSATDMPTDLVFYTGSTGRAPANANVSSGSERLRITSGGNIGIGTVTPLALYRSLSIHGPANDQGGVLDLATKDLSSRGYVFNDSNGLFVQTATNHPIVLRTNSTEKVRITSNGSVGIGTNNPNRLLQVDGASGGNGQVLISTNGAFSGTDTADLSFRIYANPSNGNAHNPQAQIQAVGTGSYDAALTFKTAVGGSDNNTPLERLRITSDGRVAINYTNPDSFNLGAKLIVKQTGADIANGTADHNNGGGSSNTRGIHLYQDSNDDKSIGLWFTTGGHMSGISGQRSNYGSHWGTDLRFYTHTGNTSNVTQAYERLRITDDGSVGIGTDNPDIYSYGGKLLTVSDSSTYTNLILASSDASNSGISFGGQTLRRAQIQGGNGSDSDLIFMTNSSNSGVFVTEKVRIKSDGKVGISSATPKTDVDISQKTGAVALPQGTTAQRPSGSSPYIRYNTTNSALEFYNGTSWVEIITDYFPTGSTILG